VETLEGDLPPEIETAARACTGAAIKSYPKHRCAGGPLPQPLIEGTEAAKDPQRTPQIAS